MPLDSVPGLGPMRLRPIRPDDAAALVRYFERLTPEDVRLRFFAPLRSLSTREVERFTRVDGERETALVLEAAEAGRPEILSIGRLARAPEGTRAEFAVSVRSDLKGRGIGRFMLTHLVEEARRRGFGEIFGDILEENEAMLALSRELGFALAPVVENAAIIRATRAL
ncbi:MAG: N-acetyltransferase [Alphaproteobacteria bacterium]|nr:N-acetyltransferase [Alphaproteobacteria bacterium]